MKKLLLLALLTTTVISMFAGCGCNNGCGCGGCCRSSETSEVL